MSTQPKKNQEEEIDLGSLFVIIGRGFSNLFNFFANIFKSLFNFLIHTLLFLKTNAIKIAIAGILGAVLGFFLDFKKEPMYTSTMLVQPNFESVHQLYNNIAFYNDLVKQKDSTVLANTFGISENQAASLKKFEISPIKSENDILKTYDEIVKASDTTSIANFPYKSFKEKFTDFDYRNHRILVNASTKDIFTKLSPVIIAAVSENSFFKKAQDLSNKNLIRSDDLFRKNLAQIDSLQKAYITAVVENARKSSTGTSIDVGGNSQKKNKEIELFETSRRINNDLGKISEKRTEKFNIINVVSDFQSSGHEVKGLDKNYSVKLFILGVVLMILFLLLVKLNTYLENYKK